MRRKFLIGAAVFLGLLLILAIAVFWYIRSGRLDRYVQSMIIEGLSDFGIRAEIEDTKLSLSGYTVTLKNIKLFAGEADQPFGSVENMVVSFSVKSYLQQQINIVNVTVDHPQVWVSFDEQGQSNLGALHPPKSTEDAKESAITFLSAVVKLNNGELHYTDQFRKVTAEITDFNVSFDPKTPEALEEKINHKLTMGFTQASATYEGRPINNIISSIEAEVTDKDANFTKLELASDLGKVTGTARVESFAPLKYETADLRADAQLEQIARVFMPDSNAKGKVSFQGKISGTDDEYKAEGTVTSDEVSAEGFTATTLRVETNASGKGDRYEATAEFSSGAVSGRDITIGSIKVNDVTVSGKGADYKLSDALSIASIKSGKINVNNLTGSLTADPDRVGLARFSANVLGGSVTGSALLATGGGSSQIETTFRSIDLNQAAELAAARDVRVTGTANGSARLSFPGTNYQAATGRINATFDAAITRPEATESAPAKGEISLVATGRGFNVERATVRSTNSELIANGSVGWNGAASLAVNFRSEDMAEVQRVIEAFGLIPADAKRDYPIAVSGPGSFIGRVTGKLDSPTVAGHLSLASIGTKQDEITDKPGEQIGALEADITYSQSLVRVENGSLVRDADSRIDFTVSAPLVGANNIAVQAQIQNFDLSALAAVRFKSLGDMVKQGTVSGLLDLRGLPGPRTIEGTAKLTLSAGEFIIPGEEEGQDKKVSVPAFTGDITLANSVVNVENLKLQIGDSEIIGQGNFNLDTYAYSVNAQGRNIDLAAIADGLKREGQPSVSITGRADVDVVGQGLWGKDDDLAGVNLNATIQGKNVIFNGRELGDAKIVATTDNGLLRVEATANVLDEMRTLTATVNLRERGWPINASVEFTDTDLGPYLGLVSPELAGISGRATGRITVSGPINPPGGDIGAGVIARAVITRLELGGNISERQRYTVTNQGDIVVTASTSAVTIEPVTFIGEGTSVTIEGVIASEAARSNLRVNGELNLRFLSSFTPSVFTTGIARVEASIIGSLESPQLRGVVNLRDVGVRVVDFPLSIARGNGAIRFTANQALIENFVAAAPGGGTITIGGGAALSGLAPERWRLEVNADQVGIEFPRDTQTVFDASLALQGNQRANVLTGDVHVRRSAYTRDITIEELLTGGGPLRSDFLEVGGPGGGGGGGASGPAISLDLHVTADNTLVIKNNLADAIASAFINIRGSAEEPLISGRVQLTRGTLEFRRGRFELTRGLISLPGRRRAEPILDIQTEADISGYHIEVSFTGEISRLQTTVRSEPQLPETDIISLVLTGNVSGDSSTQASVTQTGLGLAQSILSASLSEQLEKGTQRLFGLSRFSIDPLLVGRGSDPTARITIGQRITKDLTVTYSQNLTSGPSGIDRVVLVEYRISNRFSVVGLRNERGELGFDVRLRKRF